MGNQGKSFCGSTPGPTRPTWRSASSGTARSSGPGTFSARPSQTSTRFSSFPAPPICLPFWKPLPPGGTRPRSPSGSSTSTAGSTPPAYVLNRQNRHIESLFAIYRAANARGDQAVCQLVARFFKRLISICQNPDIILILVSDTYFQDFFSCLAYLEENASIGSSFRRYFSEHSRFNNYLDIDNPEILSNINNNFRITFLKEFIFPTFLTDRQIEELNTFLFLHNNTIVCHINSIMAAKMARLDAMIERDPAASHEFFNELFFIFKGTIPGLKTTFIQRFIELDLHAKVAGLLEKAALELTRTDATEERQGGLGRPPIGREAGSGDLQAMFARLPEPVVGLAGESVALSSSNETPKPPREKVVSVCLEILSFLSKNSQKAFFKVLGLPLAFCPRFLELIPRLIGIGPTDFYKEFLDLFACHTMNKTEEPEPDFQDFILKSVIPFMAGCVSREALRPPLGEAEHRKTLYFVVELFNIFFQYQTPALCEALVANSVLREVSEALKKTKNKSKLLVLLRYVKESVAFPNDALPPKEWRKAFGCLWSCYLSYGRRRTNQLHSMALLIFEKVRVSESMRVVKQFVKVVRKHPAEVQSEEVLEKIVGRFEKLKSSLHAADLDLTSESETSLTQEKCKKRISDSFLEAPFYVAMEMQKTGKDSPTFLTPKDPMQELLGRSSNKGRTTRDEIDIVRVTRWAEEEREVKLAIDDKLLAKRPSPDEQ